MDIVVVSLFRNVTPSGYTAKFTGNPPPDFKPFSLDDVEPIVSHS